MHPTFDYEYMYSEQSAMIPDTAQSDAVSLRPLQLQVMDPNTFVFNCLIDISIPRNYVLSVLQWVQILEEYGDFDDSPLDSESDSMIFVCDLS